MRTKICISFLSLFTFFAFTTGKVEKVDADVLVQNVVKFQTRQIEIDGKVVHVCGVDSLKMKIKTSGGHFIKVVPDGQLKYFSKSLLGKTVRLQGVVSRVETFDSTYLKKVVAEKKLLCSIDHYPCIDSVWVDKQKRAGSFEKIFERNLKRLKIVMEKERIFLITVTANKLMLVEK